MVAARDWLERFWEKVDQSLGPDACWPWTGGYNRAQRRAWEAEGRKRPIFRLGGGGRKGDVQIMVYAHRLALCLDDGTNYDDHAGQECCHSCHNFRCVNPRHLRWDTPENNRRDRYGDRDRGTNVPVPLLDEGNMKPRTDTHDETQQPLPGGDTAGQNSANTTPGEPVGAPVPEPDAPAAPEGGPVERERPPSVEPSTEPIDPARD